MSPRPGPRMDMVWLRLPPAAITDVDKKAKAAGVKRSELLRRMLAYAARTMPQDWKP